MARRRGGERAAADARGATRSTRSRSCSCRSAPWRRTPRPAALSVLMGQALTRLPDHGAADGRRDDGGRHGRRRRPGRRHLRHQVDEADPEEAQPVPRHQAHVRHPGPLGGDQGADQDRGARRRSSSSPATRHRPWSARPARCRCRRSPPTFTDSAILMFRVVAVTGLVIAVADYVVVRMKTMKKLKMSKYEITQEHKQSEGDPHMKAHRRAVAMSMSRNRMMSRRRRGRRPAGQPDARRRGAEVRRREGRAAGGGQGRRRGRRQAA